MDVGEHEDRPDVLRVDDLGAPGHLQNHIGESGADDQIAGASRGGDPPAGGSTDQVVVAHQAGVGVELLALSELEQVAPVLAIDHQHELAGLQRTGHG